MIIILYYLIFVIIIQSALAAPFIFETTPLSLIDGNIDKHLWENVVTIDRWPSHFFSDCVLVDYGFKIFLHTNINIYIAIERRLRVDGVLNLFIPFTRNLLESLARAYKAVVYIT
ncbi:hypothetical protein ACJX0J_040093 [Zea mays]